MSFGKSFLASLLAFFVGLALLFFLFFVVIGIVVSSSSQQEKVNVKSNTILHVKLNSPIVENASTEPLDFDFGQFLPFPATGLTNMGLYQIIDNLEYAAKDDNIAGIFLNMAGAVNANWGNLTAIRDALEAVKDSGKFIYAYSEAYTENSYYLASVADSIFLPSEGIVEHNGFLTTPAFFAGLLEKLEVNPQIFRVGTFKSAIEPYIRKEMSEESRLQSQVLLNDFWEEYAERVAPLRNMTPEKLGQLNESFVFGKGNKALSAGLIDGIVSGTNMRKILNRAVGKEDLNEKPPLLSLKKYMRAVKDRGEYTRDRVAVVVVDGVIQPGKSTDGVAGSSTIVNELRKARTDDHVKAVVLRINSPGGVLLSADLIKKELELLLEVKPVVASMGDVAASGGYYIAAPCDTIFAQSNTITGSIGVFIIMFNTEDLFGEKLGVTYDEVETHAYSGLLNPNRPMSEAEKQLFQSFTEEAYSDFVEIVRSGRNFPDSASVDEIAQGRIWSGKRALELGLVDVIGDLNDAIDYAAQRAGLENYRVRLLPQPKSPLDELLESMQDPYAMLKADPELQREFEMLMKFRKYIPKSGVYALMPYEWEIE